MTRSHAATSSAPPPEPLPADEIASITAAQIDQHLLVHRSTAEEMSLPRSGRVARLGGSARFFFKNETSKCGGFRTKGISLEFLFPHRWGTKANLGHLERSPPSQVRVADPAWSDARVDADAAREHSPCSLRTSLSLSENEKTREPRRRVPGGTAVSRRKERPSARPPLQTATRPRRQAATLAAPRQRDPAQARHFVSAAIVSRRELTRAPCDLDLGRARKWSRSYVYLYGGTRRRKGAGRSASDLLQY